MVLYATAAFVVGLYFGAVLEVMLFTFIVITIVNQYHLYRLTNWLLQSKRISPPPAPGIWQQIYDGIYLIQRRNRNKRKNLGDLVKRFREGAESLPDALVLLDDQLSIQWCNRLARIELGLRWPEDMGRRIDSLIRHPDFIRYFRTQEHDSPVVIPSPLNANKLFEYRLMNYGNEEYLLIVRDVTRVSQLEDMRKDFVANVSHEMRTPLTVVHGYVEILQSILDEENATIRKALQEMDSQTSRMRALIEDLLVLSRIESSAERIFEKTIDVSALMALIDIEAKSINRDKGHKIHYEVAEGLTLYGVETEIRSACSNLLFNAINYTPPGGEIWVSWRLIESGVEFSVRDNGDGIEEHHIRRLTERFYRVDKARSRKTGGSGLGLSIVKHVLNHHNSSLSITSELGKGSTFSFVLMPELIATVSAPSAGLSYSAII